MHPELRPPRSWTSLQGIGTALPREAPFTVFGAGLPGYPRLTCGPPAPGVPTRYSPMHQYVEPLCAWLISRIGAKKMWSILHRLIW